MSQSKQDAFANLEIEMMSDLYSRCVYTEVIILWHGEMWGGGGGG